MMESLRKALSAFRARADSTEESRQAIRTSQENTDHGGISRRGLLNGAGVVGVGLLTASVLPEAARAQTTSTTQGYQFSLRIADGLEVGAFKEIVRISTEMVPEFTNSGKLSGKALPPSITLLRGESTGLELWVWHESARAGILSSLRDATLVIFDTSGSPVARFLLKKAWPSKLEIVGKEIGGSGLLLESVTFSMESIERVAAAGS